jgi:hypothetical protein
MGTGSDAGRSMNVEHSAVASTELGIIRGAQCCSQHRAGHYTGSTVL